MKKLPILLLALLLLMLKGSAQNIGINATGAQPNTKAMLDVSSTTTGVLIPRMSTAERNAITSPPNGLQIYNTGTNSLDIYRDSYWGQVGFADTTIKMIWTLADLPTPVSGEITLDSTKTYSFSGLVNISPNYINLNGAMIKGTNPVRDGVLSSVNGAVLRSSNTHVYIEKLLVVLLTANTKAYDFSDNTATKSCNLITGNNVKQTIVSAGVGQISGFRAVVLLQNYFDVSDGIKVTGNMGRFVSGYNLFNGITAGAAIEFLAGLVVDDIDLSNNHFIYSGQTGIKVNVGATIDYGRMTTNMFRGVGTSLSGFDSYSPSWAMQQNTGIPNSRSFSTIYMNDNLTTTSLTAQGTYYKIAGTTSALSTRRFSMADNQLTYIGKNPVTVRVLVVIGGKSPANNADYTIAVAKNGYIIANPASSMGSMVSGQGFQIVLESEVDLVNGDFLEVGLKRNTSVGNSIAITDLQFRVNDM